MELPRHKNNAGNAAPLTATPVQIPTVTPTAAARPEWIRLPKPGTLCPWCGLSRSKLWEVLQTGKVRNVCLRKEGALRGARLIHLAALLGYLDGLLNEADKIGAKVEGAEEFLLHESEHGAEVLKFMEGQALPSSPSKVQPEAKGGR